MRLKREIKMDIASRVRGVIGIMMDLEPQEMLTGIRDKKVISHLIKMAIPPMTKSREMEAAVKLPMQEQEAWAEVDRVEIRLHQVEKNVI